MEIERLEVWPSKSGTGRYAGQFKESYTEPGCPHPKVFFVEDGPGAAAAYSTLLAAQLAGKSVEFYFTRCSYGVVADRIRILFD